ncbi:MAG: hypothetical protein Q8M09_14085 [Pseudomonadota bacterium]|nr:hypothetical protein [Pseudomonadota bacterium]MDP1905355.1 hypothetical protein [Pseudomonadota bacterium]MDP2353489.1 hypothetical protein [Pseudomonadota bacterium]
MNIVLFLLGVLSGLSLIPPAFAHEGHDHGDAPKPVPVADAAPRFETASEAFELVGVLHGRALTLYLDDYASNAPVEKATLEVEAGKQKMQAKESEPGVYFLELTDTKPGRLGLVFTIQAGESVDLLTANLEIPAPKAAAKTAAFDWRRLGWAGLALPVLGVWVWRRRSRRKQHD